MNKELFSFLLRWSFVTTFGSVLGLTIAFGFDSDSDYHPLFLLLGFAISGLFCGFSQWAILRKKTGKSPWGWIPVTTISIPFGLFIGFWVNELLFPFLQNWTAFIVMSITAGLVTGLLQWFVLFRGFPSPVWLLLSSVSLTGIAIFYPRPDNPIYFFDPINEIFLGVLYGGLMGLLLGIMSGVNVARIIGESGNG